MSGRSAITSGALVHLNAGDSTATAEVLDLHDPDGNELDVR